MKALHQLLDLQRLGLRAALVALLASSALADTNPPIALGISLEGQAGARRLILSWNSQTGAVYKLRWRTSLAPTVPWQTVDVFQADGSTMRVTLDGDPLKEEAHFREVTGFYDLQGPQPEIFKVEPSVLSTNGGEVYVIGQCLGESGILRLSPVNGGIERPGAGDGRTMRVVVPPMPEGTYDVAWIVDGQVVARGYKLFSVTAQPAPIGEALARLSEPPLEPPASPQRRHIKVPGKIEYPNLCLYSGELQTEAVDLVIPGVGLDFAWVRTYRSRTGRTTPMGHNWDHSYNVYVEQTSDGMAVHDGAGRRDVYFQGANGAYSRNEFFNEGSLQNNAFSLTFADGGQWQFHPFDGSSAAGKLALSVDRNGNSLSFTYDPAGRLMEVVDTLDRTNRIAYTADGFIESVTDFTGRRWTYRYHDARSLTGGPGDLAGVTTPAVVGTPHGNDFPAGKSTTYSYTRGFPDERLNHNLTAATDAAGQTLLQIRYRQTNDPASIDFDAVEATLRGVEKKDIWRGRVRPQPQNRFAVTRCIENDGVGNVREYLFDSQNRLLARREFTGRAVPDLPTTPAENRPTGKLRPGDPDFFETRYFWNVDSLCTRLELPKGNSQEWVYERAFDPSAGPRKKGDLRVARACCADVDRDGLPDLVSARFEYHPLFGSPPSHNRDGLRLQGPDGKEHVISDGWQMLGVALSGHSVGTGVWGDDNGYLDFTFGPRQSTSLDGTYTHADKFVTQRTDARGGVTTYTYDTHGNLTRVTPPFLVGNDPPVLEFEYNDDGQMTACVHPANATGHRRRDEYQYHTTNGRSSYRRVVIVDVASDPTDDPLALATSFEYDPVGNVTRVADPRGFDTLDTYNALDQLVVRQTPKTDFGSLVRCATTFTYDANDNVVQVDYENRDHSGVLAKDNPLWSSWFEYDALKRCQTVAHEIAHVLQQGGPKRATTHYVYDANDNLTEVHSPEAVSGRDTNALVTYQYDERDLLFRVTRAPASSPPSGEQYDYDANGNPARWNTDPYSEDVLRQPVTTAEYDGLDRAIHVTDPMGNTETFSYDANGNLRNRRLDGQLADAPGSAGNRRLSETEYHYDALNRLVRSVDSFFDVFTELSIGDGASTTTFAYAPNGQLTQERDDNDNMTRYTYDRVNRLATVTDPKTNLVAYGYDRCGNLVSVTETHRSDLGTPEQQFVSNAEYDGRGRCTVASDNVGNTHRYEYDSRGNLVRHHDPRGSLFAWDYDGLNRPVIIEADLDGDGEFEPLADIIASKTWDDNSRLTSTTDPNGNVTRYTYDSLDRCVLITNADGTRESLVWSPRHNLVLRTDANGTVSSNSFDLLDRCVRRDVTPAAGVASTTTLETFEYDGESRLVRASNDGISHTFVWNSRSQLAQQSSGGLTLVATHDGVGNRLSCQFPSGAAIQYAYDRLNQVTSVSRDVGGRLVPLASCGYDGPERLSRMARANGINTRIDWNGQQNTPNLPGDFGWKRVLRINHSRSGGSQVVDQRLFAYDPAQNKTARALLVPFVQGGQTNRMDFSYDRGNRLDGLTLFRDGLRTRSYELDPNGNRRRSVDDGTVQTYQMDSTLPDPADFQMNQYTLTPFGPMQYDLNGNLVSVDGPAGSIIYRYDYSDRLVQVARTVGPALQPIATFAYDALGRRISKTVHHDPPLAPVTTEYFHDADDDCDGIVEERENGALRKTYVPSHFFETRGRIMLTGADTLYFHEDELGSTVALTDATGAVLERYDYDEFGAPEFLDAEGNPMTGSDGLPVRSSPRGNAFLFHGMLWDQETGLYCAGTRDGTPLLEWTFEKGWPCRYMAPAMGRYIMRAGIPLRFEAPNGGDNDNWDFTGGSFARNKPVSGTFKIDAKKQKQWLPANFRIAGGGGGGSGGSGGDASVMFNPREYTITKARAKEDVYVWKVSGRKKADVYVWKVSGPRKKADVYVWKLSSRAKQDVYVWKLKKEEGGRHTPFHNKASYGGMTGIGHPKAALSRDILKSYFEKGDKPSQEQFKRPGPARFSHIVLKRGLAAREGGRTVGAGQVTEIIE